MRRKSKNKCRVVITIMALAISINCVGGLQGVRAEQLLDIQTKNIETENIQVENIKTENIEIENIHIENLNQGQIVSAQLEVKGWSINPKGIKEVNVYVDEQLLGKAEIGILTPEIQEKYPDYIGSEQSGFTYNLDTTKLQNGIHNLTIESVGNDEKVEKLYLSLDVQNNQVVKEESIAKTMTMSASNIATTQSVKLDPKIYIDAPVNNQTVGAKQVLIRGWALNSSGIKEVNIFVNGQKVGNAVIGKLRPDVNSAYPGYIGGDKSGYEFLLDISTINAGSLSIKVQAVGIDGTSQTSSLNVTKLVPMMNIDEPRNNETIDKQQVLVRGWALDGSGIKAVNILVDGLKVGSAAIGKWRPDVNKAIPGYIGGASSGYEYLLDTSKIKPGGVITVQAVGTDGTIQTMSVSITKRAPIMMIDEPTNNETINKQQILVRGWALNGSGIKAVNILVDGLKVGSAAIGKLRPDVNKAIPGYIGGDKSGYEYLLDTSKIKPGGLITVQAVGADGTSQTSSINITKRAPIMNIDEPKNNETISKPQVLVRGWALNGSGIKEVNILVDGQKIGSAAIGKLRPDVNKAIPGYIGGDKSGYEYILDASKIKSGSLITVQAVGTDGTSQTSSISVGVIKRMPIMNIDEPINNESIGKQQVLVRGWALNGSGIKEVNIIVNGQKVGSAAIGKLRPDVYKAYPGYIGADKSGYEYLLDISKIKPGINIKVEAVGTDGTSQTSSVNITKPVPRMNIDAPANNEVINKQEVTVKGWALNASGIKEVNILVNGQKVGSATKGLPRADVNSAYPGYKDGANSGFEYILSIKEMNIGNQTLTIQAIGIDGSSMYTHMNIINNYLTSTQYNITLDQMVAKQMAVSPQTDYYGNGWVDASTEDARYFINPENFNKETLPSIIIDTGTLNVRTLPSIAGAIITTVNLGKTYTVLEKKIEDKSAWYKIIASNRIGWVSGDYVTETSVANDLIYQFLDLSKVAGISESDLSSILSDKGELKNYANTFIQASRQYSVNEMYLVSHALLETGNGKSCWVTGVRVDANGNLINANNDLVNSQGGVIGGKGVTPYSTVYNMFGIGALDRDPLALGAKRAFNEGWISIEKAIIGGTKFVSESYINNSVYKQNTLYKMRWNPERPASHQYASDIAWAVKQVPRIKQLYDLCSEYVLHYDLPKFMN